MRTYQSIIKWSGSKRTVATKLSSMFPSIRRYYEPFLGSGAILPYVYDKNGECGDIIPELIDLWNAVKRNPSEVADNYQARWERLQKEGMDVYYEIRDNFNKNRDYNDFLFLTRTCVNGLIRFNSKGEFNNSFHLSRPGINPEKLRGYLLEWSPLIQKKTFICQDYRETISDARRGDFVFMDPPYGGTKGRYTTDAFDLNAFYDTLQDLNDRGVKWMLTFDGKAGERTYNYILPENLYLYKFPIVTGNSTFKKVEDKEVDKVEESVYLNYELPNLFANVI